MREGFIRRERNGVVWFEPSGFAAAGCVRAGFAARVGGISPAPRDSLDLGLRRNDNLDLARENFCRLFTAAELTGEPVVLSQVHSGRVVTVSEHFPARGLSLQRETEADGMICHRPGVTLITHHADCTPVFILDPVLRVVSLVHAGWRGAAAQIAAQAVSQMVAEYCCNPARLYAAVGPCICADCFETDADVPAAFRASMGERAEPYIRRTGEKWHVDLAGLNAAQLYDAGIPQAHIDRTALCTCCRPELFFSHRRMGSERGTMAAFLELI